jgi:hypothetical protein
MIRYVRDHVHATQSIFLNASMYTIDRFHAAVLDMNYEAGIVGSYHVPTECDR